MTWMDANAPETAPPGCPALEAVIVPRTRDLGGFSVRRVLPAPRRQMVGPFIFFDQMGPADLSAGQGIDVRPHPHIGLATVTYLFEGEILHRDSLGSVQPIRPGAVNWMTAGGGIVHSERTAAEVRRNPSRVSGIQAWVALPEQDETCSPEFVHYGAEVLPWADHEGSRVTLIAGELYGLHSPVATRWPMFYADALVRAGGRLPLPSEHQERGVYVVSGRVDLAGDVFEAGRLLVLKPGCDITVHALDESRLMLLGGAPMDGPRFIWWNFVASSRERIEQAKADWQAGRFPAVPGDSESIPLPE